MFKLTKTGRDLFNGDYYDIGIWSEDDFALLSIDKKTALKLKLFREYEPIKPVKVDNGKMSLVVHVPVWQKPKIREIFATGIHRLQEYNSAFNITVMAISSPDDNTNPKKWAKDHDFSICEFQNRPISDKFNYGLKRARATKADVVLFLGSDDLISNNYLDVIHEGIRNGKDWGGSYDAYFADLKLREIRHWAGYSGRRSSEPIGAGRWMTGKMLDRLKWKIWPVGQDSSCDYLSYDLINHNRFRRHVVRLSATKTMMVDLKGDDNITGISKVRGRNVKWKHWEFLNKFVSEKEIQLINEYTSHNTKT